MQISEQTLRTILIWDTSLTEDVIDAVIATLRNHPDNERVADVGKTIKEVDNNNTLN